MSEEGLVEAKSRKARLRPEFASWYPNILVGTWYPVLTLVRKVTRQPVQGGTDPRSARWAVGGRTLDDRHFEFRGGVQRDSSWRTRAGDTTVWPAAVDQRHASHPSAVREEKPRR